MNKSANKSKLSVIILNYNTDNFLQKCLQSILKSRLRDRVQIIVTDNASSDNSFNIAQKNLPSNPKISTEFLKLTRNIGFSAGNNKGLKLVNSSSSYVLFLNPDTTLPPTTLQKMINFFDQRSSVDAATCKIILAKTGRLQPECHRGFPTPWRAFCHFSGLAKLFPQSKTFSGYFLGHLNKNKTHPIEACLGAFLMIKKKVGEGIGWWNEKYFFYGEDLDLCYQLKKNNYKLFFYPHCHITHFQGISSGIIKESRTISTANRQTRIKAARASTQAMRIFYQDHLLDQYSPPVQKLVLLAINLLQKLRVFKAKYL